MMPPVDFRAEAERRYGTEHSRECFVAGCEYATSVLRTEGPRFLRGENVVVDTYARDVQRAGLPVHLSPRDWEFLLILAERPGAPVPRREIERRMWVGVPSKNSVALQAVRIRDKLGRDAISTVWGQGIRLELVPDDESEAA